MNLISSVFVRNILKFLTYFIIIYTELNSIDLLYHNICDVMTYTLLFKIKVVVFCRLL